MGMSYLNKPSSGLTPSLDSTLDLHAPYPFIQKIKHLLNFLTTKISLLKMKVKIFLIARTQK